VTRRRRGLFSKNKVNKRSKRLFVAPDVATMLSNNAR